MGNNKQQQETYNYISNVLCSVKRMAASFAGEFNAEQLTTLSDCGKGIMKKINSIIEEEAYYINNTDYEAVAHHKDVLGYNLKQVHQAMVTNGAERRIPIRFGDGEALAIIQLN